MKRRRFAKRERQAKGQQTCLRGPIDFSKHPDSRPVTFEERGVLGKGTFGWVQRRGMKFRHRDRDVAEKHLFVEVNSDEEREQRRKDLAREAWNTHLASQDNYVLGFEYSAAPSPTGQDREQARQRGG